MACSALCSSGFRPINTLKRATAFNRVAGLDDFVPFKVTVAVRLKSSSVTLCE